MTIQGRVKQVGQTETVGEKQFRKRELVVTTQEQYPQDIPIQFVQDKTALLDTIFTGADVTVHINVRGNEYNGKHYVSLQGWKIESSGSAPAPAPSDPLPKTDGMGGTVQNPDDLPF
jgi:hypothetical protein